MTVQNLSLNTQYFMDRTITRMVSKSKPTSGFPLLHFITMLFLVVGPAWGFHPVIGFIVLFFCIFALELLLGMWDFLFPRSTE